MSTYTRTQAIDTNDVDPEKGPYLHDTLLKTNQVLYGTQRLGVFRSHDTMVAAEGYRYEDTSYVDLRNNKARFMDTLKAVLSDSAYRSFLSLDSFWRRDTFRDQVMANLIQLKNKANLKFILPAYDSLHFLCNEPFTKNYFKNRDFYIWRFLRSTASHEPEKVIDAIRSKAATHKVYGRFIRWTSFREALVHHYFNYAKQVADTAIGLDISHCQSNDTACILKAFRKHYNTYKSVKNPRLLGNAVKQVVPAAIVDSILLNHLSPWELLRVARNHEIDPENNWGHLELYRNDLSKTWCQKWRDQLNWNEDLIAFYLDDYPDTRKLYDTLYHEHPQHFRTSATLAEMVPRIRWLVERHFSLDSIKQRTMSWDSAAYNETMDRLVAPRYSVEFEMWDSTYANKDTFKYCLKRGKRQYELTNHTGNVLATITDRKLLHNIDSDTLVDYYTADIITADDYYPFGMEMPGRSWTADSTDSYRFGFNGVEKENGLYEEGNAYAFEYRIQDARVGRFLSGDPLILKEQKYAQLSPYQFSGNIPTKFEDYEGLQPGANRSALAGLRLLNSTEADAQENAQNEMPSTDALSNIYDVEFILKGHFDQGEVNMGFKTPIGKGGLHATPTGQGVEFNAGVSSKKGAIGNVKGFSNVGSSLPFIGGGSRRREQNIPVTNSQKETSIKETRTLTIGPWNRKTNLNTGKSKESVDLTVGGNLSLYLFGGGIEAGAKITQEKEIPSRKGKNPNSNIDKQDKQDENQ